MDVIRTCHCNDRILRLNRSRKLRRISVGFEPKTPAMMMSVASVARMVGAQFPQLQEDRRSAFCKKVSQRPYLSRSRSPEAAIFVWPVLQVQAGVIRHPQTRKNFSVRPSIQTFLLCRRDHAAIADPAQFACRDHFSATAPS